MKRIILIGGFSLTSCLATNYSYTANKNMKQALNYCRQICEKSVRDFKFEEFNDSNSINTECNCN